MNKRIFLFGIGVGIIAGAGLLQLMLMGEKQATQLDHYNDRPAAVKSYTQAELDQAVAAERERVEKELKAASAASSPPQKGGSKEPAKADAGKKPVQEGTDSTAVKAAADAPIPPKRTVVRIPPNANVTEVADLLALSGVISNKKTFIDLMRTKTVRAGYFAFTGKPTLQQVSAIIMSKPLDPDAAKSEMSAAGKK
ncbi:endolytic transglycosylase MltG [Paenibacillus sp. R14(2021)]|uniref:endolytic transglycosylase MltG n=1 Tax=Paenibacillus sp. R14(2021) TaxID=2859228 RepID=UPI001C611AEE|nr:endolytic transglycosylase MltG [Paenibacillus sp. R14(2021)]